MDAVSFGVGRKNAERVAHALFDDPAWAIPVARGLRRSAREQLGTVGSGNHYVGLFTDEQGRVWVGVHAGSRGLGHRPATHVIKAGGGRDGITVDPVLLGTASDLGQEYVACMELAGRYACASRDRVSACVAGILGAAVLDEVHNHHNFAWRETHGGRDLWAVRKGATPAFLGRRGFVGGSTGDVSVILEGVESDESRAAPYATVHGAGRVMSRTQAAGKTRWKGGQKVRVSEGAVPPAMMRAWVDRAVVELRGAGADESPHVCKRPRYSRTMRRRHACPTRSRRSAPRWPASTRSIRSGTGATRAMDAGLAWHPRWWLPARTVPCQGRRPVSATAC